MGDKNIARPIFVARYNFRTKWLKTLKVRDFMNISNSSIRIIFRILF